jgi:hypothetical protein
VEVLYAQLAGELDSENDRRAFLAGVRPPDVAVTHAAPSPHQPASDPASSDAVTPEMLEQAALDLAPFLGPIGKVVVRRTAKRSSSRREFYRLLAEELDPSDRGRFLRSVGVTG